MIQIVARSEWASEYVTRDAHGVLRRHWRHRSGDPLIIGPNELRSLYSTGRVFEDGTEVDDWKNASDYVDQFAPRLAVTFADMKPSRALALAVMSTLDDLNQSEETRALVAPRVAHLLRADSVRNDDILYKRLLRLLDNEDSRTVVSDAASSRNRSMSERTIAVLSYWDAPVAA